MRNLDDSVVKSFGLEWTKFNQREADLRELETLFNAYFAIFPWADLPPGAVGFDLGCGSGRWASFVAARVGRLHCIDPSPAALEIARRNLSDYRNCEFHCSSVDAIPLPDNAADFGYSLGVLHHVPDTQTGITECVRKLKPGTPFLLYLYYAFDNRPWWFRAVWKVSDVIRRFISSLPFTLRSPLCDIIAVLIYWPLARASRLLEVLGINVEVLPLSAYRKRSLYMMRNDALDRFGTRWEQRFTRGQIQEMMEGAGLERISFGDAIYWCAVGYRKKTVAYHST